MSKVLRPNSRSNGMFICLFMTAPRTSSEYGACHPPYAKPPLVSSSGPPPAWMIPSRVTNSSAITFLMAAFLHLLATSQEAVILGWAFRRAQRRASFLFCGSSLKTGARKRSQKKDRGQSNVRPIEHGPLAVGLFRQGLALLRPRAQVGVADRAVGQRVARQGVAQHLDRRIHLELAGGPSCLAQREPRRQHEPPSAHPAACLARLGNGMDRMIEVARDVVGEGACIDIHRRAHDGRRQFNLHAGEDGGLAAEDIRLLVAPADATIARRFVAVALETTAEAGVGWRRHPGWAQWT